MWEYQKYKISREKGNGIPGNSTREEGTVGEKGSSCGAGQIKNPEAGNLRILPNQLLT